MDDIALIIVLNKPYGVLSQFTPDHPGQRTLAEFGLPPGVYPLGRLDRDSEGMLLLSDERGLNTRLLDPRHAHPRTYWAQLDGAVSEEALGRLRMGIVIEGRRTLPAEARVIHPEVPSREPPIRIRKNIPTSWIALELREGRNRQVRKMTAAVGFPTLRLIRMRIGRLDIPSDLGVGCWRELGREEQSLVLS